MKRYWSEICAALFLAVVISCFGGVIVYASSAEHQITDQMELTDLQSMVDEMLGEKTFSVTEAFHRLLSGEEVLSEESVREFLHSLLFYGIEREKELIVKCQNGHAPIWLFSGGECSDYQPKSINQKQEQTCTNE